MNRQQKRAALLVAAVLAGFALVFWLVWGGGKSNRLTVYCAHDSVYSQAVLDRFTEATGIEVDVKFDTEATKSLGLIELIASEISRPRCDVFWNNEMLGTLRLAELGCLEGYVSSEAARYPEQFRDHSGLWHGFAGRLRVYIIHQSKGPRTGEELATALESDDLSKVAIAKPLYGTTLTHYAALWSELGAEELKNWHHRCRQAGMIEANGNAVVKELVAEGVCHFGFTDTDDTFAALDAGKPVRMEPVRLPSGKTICIPNTVAIIKNAPHPEAAKQFVDFLLSEEMELALARSRSRQIPLGKVTDPSAIPEEVRELADWAAEGADLRALSDARDESLAWLKSLK